MSRCHVCERPLERRDEGVYGEYEVALRNLLVYQACFRCWFMWPDPFKRWPSTGYGREAA